MEAEYPPRILDLYREFLEAFPGEQIVKSDTECDVCCPIHDDRHPSLGIDLRRNEHGAEIFMHCRSQKCDRKDILRAAGKTDEDRYLEKKSEEEGALPGCDLTSYAQFKNLPVEFLAGDTVGLEDSEYYCRVTKRMVPAVRIPYCDEEGNELPQCARYRTGLKKTIPDTRMRAIPKSRGGEQALYGRHGIEEAQELGHTLLVEGESDCHVCWYRDWPCLGVPGVGAWQPEWAELLKGIPIIYVVVEPDGGGAQLWDSVSRCEALRGRLRKVTLRND
jgi:hypothetical protein